MNCSTPLVWQRAQGDCRGEDRECAGGAHGHPVLIRISEERPYHTRHAFARTIGCPALHPKACANSDMLLTTLLMR